MQHICGSEIARKLECNIYVTLVAGFIYAVRWIELGLFATDPIGTPVGKRGVPGVRFDRFITLHCMLARSCLPRVPYFQPSPGSA